MGSLPTRPYYSESEAARAMGLSIEEFRVLIRRHIIEAEEDIQNVPLTSFHPSDLLLLKLLAAKRSSRPAAAPSVLTVDGQA